MLSTSSVITFLINFGILLCIFVTGLWCLAKTGQMCWICHICLHRKRYDFSYGRCSDNAMLPSSICVLRLWVFLFHRTFVNMI